MSLFSGWMGLKLLRPVSMVPLKRPKSSMSDRSETMDTSLSINASTSNGKNSSRDDQIKDNLWVSFKGVQNVPKKWYSIMPIFFVLFAFSRTFLPQFFRVLRATWQYCSRFQAAFCRLQIFSFKCTYFQRFNLLLFFDL